MTRRDYIILLSLIAFTAGHGCGAKDVVEEYKSRWITLRHTAVEEATVGTEATVEAGIVTSTDIQDVGVYLYYGTESGIYQVAEMKQLEGGQYFGLIPSHPRGTLIEYFIEARAGDDLVVRVPREEQAAGFTFYFKGIPNKKLLLAHIILMFVSLFILLLAGYLAFMAIRNRKLVLHIPRLSFLGAAIFFVSSFPLGMIVAYQTYGKAWSGFPLGTDLTDNKSLGIVAYWAVATFLYRGSVFRKDPHRDLLSMRALPYVYLVGSLITLAVYLIPH